MNTRTTYRGSHAGHVVSRDTLGGKSAKKRKKAGRSVTIEPLEERKMMSVVYHPVFGTEAQKNGNGSNLSSPPIYLVFWGSYWGGTNTPQAQAIENAANKVVNSTFLHVVQQYGSDGNATIGDGSVSYAYDGSNPTSGGFDDGNISSVIENQIDNGPLPEGDGPANEPIYVVVTPPNVNSSVANAAGFNYNDHDYDFPLDFDTMHSCWVWSGTNGDNTVNVDQFSLVFSHEIAESMSDTGGGGAEFYPGASWTGGGSGNQIGDYEPNSYSFREPDGALIQPEWSRVDNAAVADNGTTQNFDLYPIWNGTKFTGTYNLVVNGDQRGSHDDLIAVGKTSSGGVSVTLNGENTSFDPGRIKTVTVNSGDGQDTIFVQDTIVPTTINSNSPLNGPDDTVIIGDGGNTQGIIAPLTITNSSGYDVIDVSDSTDPISKNVRVADASTPGYGAVTGIAPTEIDFPYSDTRSLFVDTGTGFSNTVNVVTTRVPTTVTGHAGANDTVNVGSNSTVQGIGAKLTIGNFGGQSAINVDDGVDTTARTVVLSDAAPGIGSITGLGAAEIDYNYAQTRSLNLTLGVGGNTVEVFSTGAPISLLGGWVYGLPIIKTLAASSSSIIPILFKHGGPDTINVGPNGTVQNIHGSLSIENAWGSDTINVNDNSDPTARTVTLDTTTPASDPVAYGTIAGLAPATISYEYDDSGSLAVTLGVGGNTVNVHSTGAPTSLLGGAVPIIPPLARTSGIRASSANSIIPIPFPMRGGPDTINVGKFGNTQSISGALTIENAWGQDTINVDDGTDSTAQTVTLDTTTPASDAVPYGTITGLSPAPINYEYADTKSLSVTLGVGGNTANVHATGVPTSILGGSVLFILPLARSSSSSNIIPIPLPRHGGPDTVNVGNAGNAQDINGPLTIENSWGQDTVTVDDSADTTARSVALGTAPPAGDADPFGTVSGLTPAPITYEAADTSSLTIDGGSGGNTFNVTDTPTNQFGGSGGTAIALNAGAGNDAVNVTGMGDGTTLAVNGQAGADTLTVTGVSAADSFALTAGQVVHGSSTINYSNVEDLRLKTGTFNVTNDLNGVALSAIGAATSVNLGASQHLAGLNVNGGRMALSAGGGKTIFADALAIAGGGKLDLADNRLMLSYSGPDPIATIRSYLSSGYTGGAWTGAGLNTSSADLKHGLGLGDSADGVVAGLPANTILIKYAKYGDVNLDGNVDFSDMVILSRNFGKANMNWDQGDLDYDGTVDFQDLVTCARNMA